MEVDFDRFFFFFKDDIEAFAKQNNILIKDITTDSGVELRFLINRLNNFRKPCFFFRSLVYIKDGDASYSLIRYTPNNIKYTDDIPTQFNYATDYWIGTLVTLIYINNEWEFLLTSTDANQSQHRNNKKDYGDLILETINLDELGKYLNINHIYYFSLVHYENNLDNKIDYTEKLGPEYKKMIFLETRDISQNLVKDLKFENAIYSNELYGIEKVRFYKKSEVNEKNKYELVFHKNVRWVKFLYRVKKQKKEE